MNLLEVFNLVSSISSIILSILAIWLALYFYNHGRDVEKNSEKALEGIKTQSDSLQRLTAKWMDRLTRHITDQKPAEETILEVVQLMREYPTSPTASLNIPQNQEQIDNLTKQAISGYIGIYYYSALTNVFAQQHLPLKEDFDPTSDYHNTVKSVLDFTSDDVLILKGVLQKIEESELKNNPIYSLLEKTETFWKPEVRNSVEVFELRSV